MLLGKHSGVWCSMLEYSCISEAQVSQQNDKTNTNLSEFVWFESTERSNQQEPFRGNVGWKASYPDIKNLVWFEEGSKKLQDRIKVLERNLKLSGERISESQNQQLRKILETNPNLFR